MTRHVLSAIWLAALVPAVACDGGGGGDGADKAEPPTDGGSVEDADDDGEAPPEDCDDGDPDIHPGAEDVPYDDIDQDCDGSDLTDVDGDGSDGEAAGGDDCDDDDDAVHPGADEEYYDGIDNDCSAVTVDDDQDGDGDPRSSDCDNVEPDVSSATAETYYDGLDNDCDPATIDDDQDDDRDPVATDCDDEDSTRSHARRELYYDGVDNDCRPATVDDDQDADGDPFPGDCDDLDPAVSSSASEVVHDDLDNDCDPATLDDPLLDPVAVGFALETGLLADGSLADWDTTYGAFEPTLTLTFATYDYFNNPPLVPSDETCVAFGVFRPTPLVQPAQIPTFDGVLLHTSFDSTITLEYTDCNTELNPAIWGTDGEDLLTAFDGAHIGYGFGPMTDYLRDAWDAQSLIDAGDGMLATYVAINDADGDWIATDWTTSILFEWDPVTHALVVDPATNLLTVVDVTGTAEGELLPEGYIRPFPYWYQDFPLMDLSNLRDPPN